MTCSVICFVLSGPFDFRVKPGEWILQPLVVGIRRHGVSDPDTAFRLRGVRGGVIGTEKPQGKRVFNSYRKIWVCLLHNAAEFL